MTDEDLRHVAGAHPMTAAQREAFRGVDTAALPDAASRAAFLDSLRAAHEFAATFPVRLGVVPGADEYFSGLLTYFAFATPRVPVRPA